MTETGKLKIHVKDLNGVLPWKLGSEKMPQKRANISELVAEMCLSQGSPEKLNQSDIYYSYLSI